MVEELESDEQMLDTAVGAAIEVLAAGNDIGPSSVESAFVDLLSTLGPRAATVRDLAKTLDRARFDIDIAWRQPARTTRRVHVTARSAAHIADVVEHASLDEQPVYPSSANTSPSAPWRPGLSSKTTATRSP